MWINKNEYEKLISENEELRTELIKLKDEFTQQSNKSINSKALKANDVLNSLGIASHTESGKQIRSVLALELLGAEYDMVDKHSKAAFINLQGADVLVEVRKMLEQEGVLTKRRLEKK